MELRQLRYFVKAAETLNFSEAAKGLYITQSTLSQQIRQLETELDVQLFQRNSHEVTLTEAGAELLPYAKETLYAADTCKEHIRDLQQLLTGTLNIGVTYSFSPILTETVLAFMNCTRSETEYFLQDHDGTDANACQARSGFRTGLQTHTPLRTDRIAHPLRQPSVGHRAFRPCLGPETESDTQRTGKI